MFFFYVFLSFRAFLEDFFVRSVIIGTESALYISEVEADAEKEAALDGVVRYSQPSRRTLDVGLGTKSVCQRDLDSMERIGDTRKPWDRVVPIYHAMLSEGGRAMHSFLGFLGTVILLLAMVNHAHADTGLEDAEGLRSRVVLEAGEIDSSQVERIQALADSGHAESGLQAIPDSLSMGTGRMDDRGAGRRIAKKLGAGALWGSLSGLIGAVIVQTVVGLGEPGVDGIGGGAGLVAGGIIGHTVGSAIGVTLVDPHDYYILSIVGSLAGMKASIEVLQYYKEVPEFLPVFCGPVVGATIMSELLRNPPEARRISVGLGPDSRGNLVASATLRF